jgi:hypothetical protein
MSGESPTESVVLAEICLFDFGVSELLSYSILFCRNASSSCAGAF